MPRKYILRSLLLFFVVFGIRVIAFAQTDQVEGQWFNQEKTGKIDIYKATDGKFYGKICWLRVPDENGKPKVDKNNPDEKRRNDPRLGLLVLKGLKKDGDKVYNDGTVYDPENGKTYSCKITFEGDHLDVRGYIGFSLIGRTAVWTRKE